MGSHAHTEVSMCVQMPLDWFHAHTEVSMFVQMPLDRFPCTHRGLYVRTNAIRWVPMHTQRSLCTYKCHKMGSHAHTEASMCVQMPLDWFPRTHRGLYVRTNAIRWVPMHTHMSLCAYKCHKMGCHAHTQVSMCVQMPLDGFPCTHRGLYVRTNAKRWVPMHTQRPLCAYKCH